MLLSLTDYAKAHAEKHLCFDSVLIQLQDDGSEDSDDREVLVPSDPFSTQKFICIYILRWATLPITLDLQYSLVAIGIVWHWLLLARLIGGHSPWCPLCRRSWHSQCQGVKLWRSRFVLLVVSMYLDIWRVWDLILLYFQPTSGSWAKRDFHVTFCDMVTSLQRIGYFSPRL